MQQIFFSVPAKITILVTFCYSADSYTVIVSFDHPSLARSSTCRNRMNLDVMRQKWGKVKRPAVTRSWTQDTSGLSCQCSATEPRQLGNHQPSQFSICTVQVVLARQEPLSMCCQNFVKGWPENFLHQERTHAEWYILSVKSSMYL